MAEIMTTQRLIRELYQLKLINSPDDLYPGEMSQDHHALVRQMAGGRFIPRDIRGDCQLITPGQKGRVALVPEGWWLESQPDGSLSNGMAINISPSCDLRVRELMSVAVSCLVTNEVRPEIENNDGLLVLPKLRKIYILRGGGAEAWSDIRTLTDAVIDTTENSRLIAEPTTPKIAMNGIQRRSELMAIVDRMITNISLILTTDLEVRKTI